MFLKKTMILAAAIGLAMSLASAGCGGGGADENPTPSPTAAPTATPTPQPTATPAPTPEPEEDESIVAELVETVIYRVNVGGPELASHGWLADNFDEDYEAYGVKFEYIPYEPEDEDGEPSVYGPVADFPETNVELLDISDVVNAGPFEVYTSGRDVGQCQYTFTKLEPNKEYKLRFHFSTAYVVSNVVQYGSFRHVLINASINEVQVLEEFNIVLEAGLMFGYEDSLVEQAKGGMNKGVTVDTLGQSDIDGNLAVYIWIGGAWGSMVSGLELIDLSYK